jgi:hypothetical protein
VKTIAPDLVLAALQTFTFQKVRCESTYLFNRLTLISWKTTLSFAGKRTTKRERPKAPRPGRQRVALPGSSCPAALPPGAYLQPVYLEIK